ncbi:MAG: DUF1572 domain-containing protein [Bryobacteraceae bacterium]|nr:DUF1572 family protein [Solibacteraceae bacterium]MCL4840559.1 DUF1572 family protein [Bryobacteraceae bacterium]MCO5350514.1 DUF1572 domain-containing protein [Bryobacteraceae bacterium]
MAALSSRFTEFSTGKLRQFVERIEVCLGKLTEEQIWARPNPASNSAGNLCLHLSGNVRQWILAGVAGQPDLRRRDEEFAAQGGVGREQLLVRLRGTVEEACAVIEGLPETRLLEVVKPQNYEVTVLAAVYHVVEHFAMHTGQILLLTKAATGEDLGFYRHLSGGGTGGGAGEPLP